MDFGTARRGKVIMNLQKRLPRGVGIVHHSPQPFCHPSA